MTRVARRAIAILFELFRLHRLRRCYVNGPESEGCVHGEFAQCQFGHVCSSFSKVD